MHLDSSPLSGLRSWLSHAQRRYHGRVAPVQVFDRANSVFVNQHDSTWSSPRRVPSLSMSTPVGRSVAGSSGSNSGSGRHGHAHTLGDHIPPPFRPVPSDASAHDGWLDSRRHGRRETLFQPVSSTPAASAPATPAVRLAAQLGSAQASPDVYPPGADLMARLLASEAANRRQADVLRQQADVLRQQGAELNLLRSGGRAPSPDFAPDPVAGGVVARLEARLTEQQRFIERLAQQLQHPPPAAVAPPAESVKNKSEKLGRELRANPEFLQMLIGAGTSAPAVSRVVLKMFSLWGSAGSVYRQVLLWVLQLPASETSLVPAVATDAVRQFCADHLKLPLDGAGAGVGGAAGTDCFGRGGDSERRRGVFRALLVHLQAPGPLKDLDDELLISFKGQLQPSLYLSDATLTLPTFAALLAMVLLVLDHGPSSILASVVDAFFSRVPYPDVGTANSMLRKLREDLEARLNLQEQLALTPCLLAVALSTCQMPAASGTASGVLVSSVVSELMDLAADSATSASTLLATLDRHVQSSGHTGALSVPWAPPPASTWSRLLTERPSAEISSLPLGPSASPAAASLSASPVKPAPSKSASAKQPPRQPQAAAESQPQAVRAFCPHGAACPTAGDLYEYCVDHHTDADWAAIRASRQREGRVFLNSNGRRAILRQVATRGGAPSGGGDGGLPRASLPVPAAGAAALAPQPVPPSAAAQPSPSLTSAAPPSHMGMDALMQFLAAAAPHPSVHPSGVSLSLPVALAAASAPAAVSSSVESWGSPVAGVYPMVLTDSGSAKDFAPNVRGAPTIPVPTAVSVTSDGTQSFTATAFDASFVARTAGGGYVEIHVQPRDQPRLSVPLPGGGKRPVMLLSPTTVAGGGGVWHVEGRLEGRGPATLTGYVRLPYYADGQDLAVDPLPHLTDKILIDFRDKVMALPVCSLPAGAPVTRVHLGTRRPLPSASSLDTLPAQAFGGLLQLCKEWHSAASADVPAYAAMSSYAQSAFRAAHGGHDAAAFVAAGLSHFCVALTELASAAVHPAAPPAFSSSSPSLLSPQ